MKKFLTAAVCLLLVLSVFAFTACNPERTVEETYSKTLVGGGDTSSMEYVVRLKVKVNIRTQKIIEVSNIDVQPGADGKGGTNIGHQPNNYFNIPADRDAFLKTLEGRSLNDFKGLPGISFYNDAGEAAEYVSRFELSYPSYYTDICASFVIDAVAYTLSQNRLI